MSGLVIKDFMVLRKQGKSYLLILGLYALLTIMGVFNYSVMSSMMVVLVMMLPMATFSYDDLARWDKYAAAMPVGRAGIVKAKYITTLLITGGSALLCLVLNTVVAAARLEDASFGALNLTLLACLGVGVLINAVILPMMFKYGAEKARGMSMGVMLVLFILIFGLSALLAETGLESLIPEAVMLWSPVILVLFAAAALALSYRLSLRIYRRKEL